ncbi:MAG: diaminopimelate decarboxylase [Gaiellales bacterium]|nr:diaminopimelate decarboxylase [Gaiellales bacterium]
MTHTLIYPVHSAHNTVGHLEIDGCDVVSLARQYGTPLVIYEEKTLRDQCRRFVEAFRLRTAESEIIYASKALPIVALFQLVEEEGLSLDVASGGEYHTALAAGFPTERIFFHGNNKSPWELEYALQHGIGTVVVDSVDEMELLERLLQVRGARQRVLLRITPGIEAHTHEYIQTGQIDSKFGFGLAGGAALESIGRAMGSPSLDLWGLHAHIGSQIFELDSYRGEIRVLADLMREAKDRFGFDCRWLNAGGGLGVRYTPDDSPAPIDSYAEVVCRGVEEEMARVGLPMPRILIEPGRSVVAKAGVTAYTIGTVKQLPGIRTYVSVDGGMSDNIRPMLYGAKYEAMLANKVEQQPDTMVTVAGKHCESSDILARDVELPSPQVGDTLVIPATGAYCYAMASNYNGNLRPAVVMVEDGKARIIVERESFEDLVKRQRPLHG